MRRISAKIISKEITTPFGSVSNNFSNLALRIYPPQKFLDSTHNTLQFSVFKNGTKVLSHFLKVRNSRLESISTNKNGFIDFSLKMKEARYLLEAAKKGVDDVYEAFLVVKPDRMAGEIYKLSITETDQLTIAYPESSILPKTSVTREADLPSRGPLSKSFVDDSFIVSEVPSRNKNNMSNYDNNVSISYYLLNKSTIRVALTNLPIGYNKIEVLAKKTGQYKFNAESIKKINQLERDSMSNWFFKNNSEAGNGFKETGGYIVFDLQMVSDERNTIIERVNKVSQNYFRNARAQDGQLQSQPVTGIKIFPEPIVHAGETASIRIKLYSDLGRSKTYTIPLDASTMGYSAPKLVFSSNPSRLNGPFEVREVMTSNPINDSNEAIYRETIRANNFNLNDIFIDLGVIITGEIGENGEILSILGTTDGAGDGGSVSSRTGGSYLVAFVTRYDSMTGNTFNLGFTAKNRFADQIANIQSPTSLSNVIGSRSGAISESDVVRNFLNTASGKGLSLVYNFEFYEITPEMIAAYLSAESVTDEIAAPLLANISNSRSSEGQNFNLFISNILRARTPIQTSSLSFDYIPKFKDQPNIDVRLSEKQQDTNIPYYEISGQITRSLDHVAFIEVFRVEESRIIKSKIINESRISSRFTTKEIRLGVIDAQDKFSINDFTPKDNIEGASNKKEKSIKTYYKLVPYGYVLNNGLLTNSFRRLDTEIFVGR